MAGGSVFKQVDREQSLIHLMRVNLFKRMESSINSFSLTLEKLLSQVQGIIDKIDTHEEMVVEEVSIEEIDIEDEEFIPFAIGNKVKVLIQDVDKIKWKQELEEDQQLLVQILAEAREIDAARDQKLASLKSVIQKKAEQPINSGNRKIIIFTAFADTANYLYQNIAEWAQQSLGLYSGLVTGSGNNRTTMPGIKKDMLYPRLKLARNLLCDGGFLVVSIDDAELNNLRYVLNEIIGEENYLATLVWDRNRKNDAKYFSVGHEYMVIYTKNEMFLRETGVKLRSSKEGIEELRIEFERLRKKHSENWADVAFGLKEFYKTFTKNDPRKPLGRFLKVDEKGPFRTDGNPSWPGGGGPKYDVPHPVTGKPCKVPSRGWVWPTYDRMKAEIDNGMISFGKDETTIPGVRINLFSKTDQVMRSVTFSYAQKSAQDFARLFDGKKVFDNPKSYVDISRLVDYLTSDNSDIILDFFCGSATTAHATLDVNKKDNGNRRFIMVQLPEPCNEKSEAFIEGYGTIADIGKERIRRVIDKIKEESPEYEGDLGFKVFKLDSTNIKPWEADFETFDNKQLETLVENIKPDRKEADVVYEILLKYGLDLTLPIEERTIAGKKVFIIGLGALIICLADNITIEVVEGIAKLKKELTPELMRVVFKDNGFPDDVVKTNTIQILRQHGIDDVKSL
ncbi:MAG: site-specific DNA-methyltransferase, partial [SAR324 cluster bacterium]|nr:site-specific DNA-methyltransferase [SAR324 cluster bacterium]